MLVFKKNWIYRYNEWCNGNMFTVDNVNDSKSICAYFWKTMWNLFPVNFLYLVVAHAPAVCGLWLERFNYLEGIQGFSALYCMLFAGYLTLAVFLLTLTGVILLYTKVGCYNENHKKSNPNLVVEYLKAKKSKVCPMIKWED